MRAMIPCPWPSAVPLSRRCNEPPQLLDLLPRPPHLGADAFGIGEGMIVIRPLRPDEVNPASFGIPASGPLHVLEVDGRVMCYGDESTLLMIRDYQPTEPRPRTGLSYRGIPIQCDPGYHGSQSMGMP